MERVGAARLAGAIKMTKSTTGQGADAAQDTATKMAEKMTEQMKAAGDTLRKSGERMAETGTELGMRLLDQAEANTREAFAAMRAAAHAKDAAEVMRIQSDYLRDQGNRAMEQAREIGSLITSYGREAIERITKKD